LQKQTHTQSPSEKLLLEVFHAYVHEKSTKRGKAPAWAKQIKEIIQDQIDTNLNLSLKEVAAGLDMNPAYVSREFSKYFSDLSFGDYIRKLRIEKSIELLTNTSNSLAEIAYLTGFSDQSHFNRIFKQHTGQNPSVFRKSIQKK
jgi:AraC-like DNA-binding protein